MGDARCSDEVTCPSLRFHRKGGFDASASYTDLEFTVKLEKPLQSRSRGGSRGRGLDFSFRLTLLVAHEKRDREAGVLWGEKGRRH